MPVAPEARAVLDLIAAANRPPYHTLSAPEARQEYKRGRSVLQPSPPQVAAVGELAMPGPHGSIAARAYRPLGAGAEEVLPALVYLHGGGWVIGDLETHDVVCRTLANEARCAVISVDYRLAPEHRFPVPLEDCIAATSWVAEEARQLRIDRERLAVGGDSAGANLATVVALAARDAGGPKLAFQLLIYPATIMNFLYPSQREFGQGHLLTREVQDWFRDSYVSADQYADWRCSPLLARDVSGLPPALVLTAECDPLRDEGKAYADRLREAGVPVAYTCYPGMIHGFITMGRLIPAAGDALRECGRALASAFTR